jgi:hypothetical protein
MAHSGWQVSGHQDPRLDGPEQAGRRPGRKPGRLRLSVLAAALLAGRLVEPCPGDDDNGDDDKDDSMCCVLMHVGLPPEGPGSPSEIESTIECKCRAVGGKWRTLGQQQTNKWW